MDPTKEKEEEREVESRRDVKRAIVLFWGWREKERETEEDHQDGLLPQQWNHLRERRN